MKITTHNRRSYVKQQKLLTTFKMSDMSVFLEYKYPFQRLVGKVGNNFLSAGGMGHEKVVLTFSIMPRTFLLFYFIFFLLVILNLKLLYVV